MTRRRMRPLNMIRTGSPTLEDRTKRPVTRRFMRHLTSGATPPPIPLPGYARRMMVPITISDYEGISTASWSSGVTGNFSSVANSSWNCLYYHTTTPNTQTTAIDVIMQPIRWQIACPTVNGGTYNFWANPATSRYTLLGESSTFGPRGGQVGMNERFLVSGHFASLQQGFAELLIAPGFNTTAAAGTTGVWPRTAGDLTGNAWAEATLEAIAAATTNRCRNSQVSMYAIRHRVNNAAVGTLEIEPSQNRDATDAWRFDISPGDVYELDVWYRLRFTPSLSYPASTGKACWYIPTTRVSNGSRRPTAHVLNYPCAVFRNINYSPNFNYQTQTYNITISGHSGYTLKDGSDGPHKMISGGGWRATIQNGTITWEYLPGNGYINGIVIRWDREIPQIEFWPGPLHSLWAGSALASQPIYYRPSVSGYRSSTASGDFGTITHSQMASYDQAGSTDFFHVSASLTRLASQQGAQFSDLRFFEGRAGPPPSIATDLPTLITIARTTQ